MSTTALLRKLVVTVLSEMKCLEVGRLVLGAREELHHTLARCGCCRTNVAAIGGEWLH